MDFRQFLERLDKNRELEIVKDKLSPELEMARKINEVNKPVLFENVNDYKVSAGVCISRDVISDYLGIKKEELLSRISKAVKNPIPPKIISQGLCREVEEENVDLEKIPILKHYKGDDGSYITAGLVIAESPKYGRNACYHRLKRVGKNKFAARICDRDTMAYLKEAGGNMDVAISLGNTPSALIAAATSPAIDVDEFAIAGGIEGKPVELVKCGNGIAVPANCELVLEGRINGETAKEGKFVDMTGTYDVVREQPVIEITRITHRKNPVYQALMPGQTEHRLLMGMPKEPTIFNAVNKVCKCINVNLTPGGCSWLHCVVQIDKQDKDDGKKAVNAAFEGHKSLKMCTIVDKDIDLFDPEDVEWAVATRFQADKDLVIMPNQKGSSLDPSSCCMEGTDRKATAKMGIDATIPFDMAREDFEKVVE